MENQMLRTIQQNITNSFVRPTYADEAVVAHTVKAGKDEKGKIVKEAHLQLVFLDMTTQKPTDKIVISPLTALGLQKALAESLSKINKELKSKRKIEKEKPKKPEIETYIR